tara:strand:- start:494 stop:748 length:255 start_codon:yes stop_codon:yes gene_type:complete
MANMNLENEVLGNGQKYFTLAVYCELNKKWFNEFGDYDKEYVADEIYDLIHGYQDIKPKHIKLLKTTDDQKSIDAAIDKLNEVA